MTLADDTELTLTAFPSATGRAQANILWIPSEYGLLEEEIQLMGKLSSALSDASISIWLPDLFDAWFLPASPSSLDRIGYKPVAELIRLFTGKDNAIPLIIITADKGATLVLRALHELQLHDALAGKSLRNTGVILINPNLNIATPAPGETARYQPVTHLTNLPLFIMQAELSPWRWSLPRLVSALEKSGSDVFYQPLANVRDRFYFRPDASPIEERAAKALPAKLIQAMKLLSPYMEAPRPANAAQPPPGSMGAPTISRRQSTLLPAYRGAQDKPLVLRDLSGNSHNLQDYRGKVVLLNFWASWCPPCVHEIPSMVRLKQRLDGKPFEIIAVNLGEKPDTIRSFLKRTPVNFPVLIDEGGIAVKSWKVSAYPTSFIIDKSGKIRFALFGGFEWDSAQAIEQLQKLLDEGH